MKIAVVLSILLLSFSSFCQNSLNTHYKIHNTQTQKSATIYDIIAQMDKADVLFFGEKHNDSTGHQLEYLLLNKLAGSYPGKMALSMEMFETDCQTVLNEYLAGLIREKNFRIDARVWPNYKDYQPLIEFSKSNHIPVVAVNAPVRYTNMVNRLGLTSQYALYQ